MELPSAFARFADRRSNFQNNVTACVKLLLEEKHLYQSVPVILPTLYKPETAREWRLKAEKGPWDVRDNATSSSASGSPRYDFMLRVPDVKLFCDLCTRVEAFNSISGEEFTSRGNETRNSDAKTDSVQIFVLSFQCQSCKTMPEVFLIRRQGLKLTLCGRAPMEVARVPPVIPSTIRQYYSGALVAHQSGQTLAGLFLLRTLIEQWARSQVKTSASPRIDKLIDKYMHTLPSDFKSRFPSMRELYEKLSADLHDAAGSGDLFDKTAANITEHFEARRLFKL